MTDKDKIIDQLQKENKQLREWQEANKATGICETCTHKTLLKNDELKHHIRELNKLNAKYKQALDDIEEVVKRTSGECFYNDCEKYDDCENCDMNLGGCSTFNLRLIKHIINKTKDK